MSSANDMGNYVPCYNCSGLYDSANVFTLTRKDTKLTFCSLICLTQYTLFALSSSFTKLAELKKIMNSEE